MAKRLILLAGSILALAQAPTSALATTTVGTLGNFDAVNDTGKEAHGFEIDLEGLHSSDITDTFGGTGRGFPSTVERYGAPSITEYASGGVFGVKITYKSALSAGAWAVGTPSGVYSTPGESCWSGGGSYNASTPCDHFGVGTVGNATKTTYSWLVEATPGSASLVNATNNLVTPQWTVTPAPAPPPGSPPAPPVVVARIQSPDPVNGAAWGAAMWVKVFTTESDVPINLHQLVNEDPVVQAANANPPEIEWQLLQTESGVANSGVLENGGAAAVGAGAESIIRRYEFYAYSGLYSLEGEALPSNGDTTPGPDELGHFLGDQNAAVNFAGGPAGAGVPESTSWALMLFGVAALGARLRALKRAAGVSLT